MFPLKKYREVVFETRIGGRKVDVPVLNRRANPQGQARRVGSLFGRSRPVLPSFPNLHALGRLPSSPQPVGSASSVGKESRDLHKPHGGPEKDRQKLRLQTAPGNLREHR